VGNIEVDDIAATSINWFSHNEASALQTVADLIFNLTSDSDKIIQFELLVLGVLDDEKGWDRACVDKSKGTLLLGVDFGQLKVDNRLKKLNDGTSEVCLNWKTDRRTVLYLNVETGDGLATFFAANLNFEVNFIRRNLSFNHFGRIS